MANSMSEYRQNGVDYIIDDPTVAPVFLDNTDYPAGQYVKHEGNLYKFTTEHPAGAWNASHVVQTNLGQDVCDLNRALSQMSDIYDEIRNTNIFEGTQLEQPTVVGAMTVSKKEYSGVHLEGTLNTGNQYISAAKMNFVSGQSYTMVVLCDSGFENLNVRIVGITSTKAKNSPYYFTPSNNVSNTYITVFYSESQTLPVNGDLFIYIFPGTLTMDQIFKNIYAENTIKEYIKSKDDEIINSSNQIASIKDHVKRFNMFEGTQFDEPKTVGGMVVTKIFYSGIKIQGTLNTGNQYVSRAMLNFTANQPYTLFVQGKGDNVNNIYVRIVGITMTKAKNEAIVFKPASDISDTYITLFYSETQELQVNEELYIYIVPGEYTNSYFSSNRDNEAQDKAFTSFAINNDLFKISLSESVITSNGLTVKKKNDYCIHVVGTLGVGRAYINRALLSFETGITYTMYVLTTNTENVGFSFTSQSTGDVKENGYTFFTTKKNKCVHFTPDADYERVYANIFFSNENTIDINDDFTIILLKGRYELESIFKGYNLFNPASYKSTAVIEALSVGLPVLKLNGDPNGMTKDQQVTLGYEYGNVSGECTVKWQGSSSVQYQKKNYTIKLDKNIDVGWGGQKKYVLKANYVDASHSLNIVTAKIWAEIVRSRGNNPAIEVGANCGAMDGFPCILMLNNDFMGLYSFNTPKDKWTFGMGSGEAEYIVTSEDHTDATKFRALAELDGTDFEIEYKPDNVSDDTVKTSLNNMISAIINSSGADWETELSDMLDVDSAIDYMIFSALTTNTDGIDKNFILTTYNGTKWFFNAYDLDTVFGNHWTGGQYNGIRDHSTSFEGLADISRLFYLIYNFSRDKLIRRYDRLRSSYFSEDSIHNRFYEYCVQIPEVILQKDREMWPLLPGTHTNTLARLTNYYRLRAAYCDEKIDSIRS